MIGPRIPNRVSSACYSMPGRISVGGFDTDYAKTPGPARYNVTTPDAYQTRAPTYSMIARNYMPDSQYIVALECFHANARFFYVHLQITHT